MALIRGHHDFDDHFAKIPNDWLRDSRLSLEARGLLAQIMSHRPGWQLSIKSIASQNSIGKSKVKRILDELMANGYLERSERQRHDERGHLAGYDYTTRDPEVGVQEPYKAEPYKVEPYKDTGTPKKTIAKKTINSEDYLEESFAQFWAIYPLKKDKRPARRAFEKALERVDFDKLLAATEAYRDDPNRETQYTKYPASWLNADAWENGPEIRRGKTTPGQLGIEMYQRYKAQEDSGIDFLPNLRGIEE